MIQYLETDCENVFRTSKHWRKKSNLQKFAKIRARRPLQTWMTVFGDRTPACREFSRPRADADSRIYAAIGRTFI